MEGAGEGGQPNGRVGGEGWMAGTSRYNVH